MKRFNNIFDTFFYQSIILFFFSILLQLLNDVHADLLFWLSAIAFGISVLLGITGYFFNLFYKEEPNDDF